VINMAPVKSEKSSLVLTLADCCEQAKAFAREVRTPLFCELVPREFLVARDGEWLFEIFLECKVGLQCGGRIACWGFEFRSRDVGVRCDAFMSINDSDIYMAVQPPLDAESDDTIREWMRRTIEHMRAASREGAQFADAVRKLLSQDQTSSA
jgi:hypothetical protein